MRYKAIEHFSSTTIGTLEPGEIVIIRDTKLAERMIERGLIVHAKLADRYEIKPEPIVPLDVGSASELPSSQAGQVLPESKPKRRRRKAEPSPSTTQDSSE